MKCDSIISVCHNRTQINLTLKFSSFLIFQIKFEFQNVINYHKL